MRNLYKKTFCVSSFNNLIVSLYVVGYKNIGEAIIVLFRDKTDEEEKVVMSMVIDSYETKGLKLVHEVLKKYNVKNLDFVCWTHPHCDHSPGIDELIRKVFHDDASVRSIVVISSSVPFRGPRFRQSRSLPGWIPSLPVRRGRSFCRRPAPGFLRWWDGE